jgi:hypothetical protein
MLFFPSEIDSGGNFRITLFDFVPYFCKDTEIIKQKNCEILFQSCLKRKHYKNGNINEKGPLLLL